MNPKPNNRDAVELSFKDHIFLLYFFIAFYPDEKISNNDPSLIECQPSGDADIDEFKTKHFKKTFYGNFKQLINGNFYNLNKLKIWAY